MAMELRRNMAINFGTIAICTLVLLADLRVTCVVVVRKKEPHTSPPPKKKNICCISNYLNYSQLSVALTVLDVAGFGHFWGLTIEVITSIILVWEKPFFTCGEAVRS